jgi:hypothetical protein
MVMKKCPDCAEDVRAEARKCRFCGFAFLESPAPKPGYAAPPERLPNPGADVPSTSNAFRTSRNGWLILAAFVVGALVLVIINPSTPETRETPKSRGREGTTISFRGVAGDADISTFARMPYFPLDGGGQTVKCYYVTGRPPTKGTYVTVSGIVTMWVEGSGGSLRPCSVVNEGG